MIVIALLLEDNDLRTQMFVERFKEIGFEYVLTTTSSEAIEELKKRKFDIIFLDHDLGGEVYSTAEDCGMRVAEYLNENPPSCHVIIHSLNIPAARQMQELIKGSSCIPYVWDIHEFYRYIDIQEEE